ERSAAAHQRLAPALPRRQAAARPHHRYRTTRVRRTARSRGRGQGLVRNVLDTTPLSDGLATGYDRGVLRIDPFVYWREGETPEQELFPRSSQLLKKFNFRFHSGKTLSSPTSDTGVAHQRANAPHRI